MTKEEIKKRMLSMISENVWESARQAAEKGLEQYSEDKELTPLSEEKKEQWRKYFENNYIEGYLIGRERVLRPVVRNIRYNPHIVLNLHGDEGESLEDLEAIQQSGEFMERIGYVVNFPVDIIQAWFEEDDKRLKKYKESFDSDCEKARKYYDKLYEEWRAERAGESIYKLNWRHYCQEQIAEVVSMPVEDGKARMQNLTLDDWLDERVEVDV